MRGELPSRNEFFLELNSRVQQCCRQGQALGLLLFKLRRLRNINLAMGYRIGDLVLDELVQRTQRILRPSDLMARVGNDEFALILPKLRHSAHAVLAANKLLEVLQTPFEISDNHLLIKVAIGIATLPEHADEAMMLMQRADIALAQAKFLNMDYAVYSNTALETASAPFALESELKNAVEQAELELCYQPKIDLRKAVVSGAEALARWTSSTHGPVQPDIFIPLAESTGLIEPLSFWALNCALRERMSWPSTISVAVNFSVNVLNDPQVTEQITQAMEIWGADPGQLVLEITESEMMSVPKRCLDSLRILHDLGIRIAIDDFGTGYSSLSYLKNLPVDEIKIDKSFVMSMIDNKQDVQLVCAIIDLAHNFGLDVVAEGVEDKRTLELLAEMGCEYAQGHYIGAPMPNEDLLRWIGGSPWAL